MSRHRGESQERTQEVVLLLCSANAARSPLAAAMLRQRLDRQGRNDIVVSSAGLDAIAGEPATPNSLVVARARGIDISDHHATPVSAASLSTATLVVTMTEADRSAILRLVPSAIPRTFTLPELVRLLAADGHPRESCAELAGQAHRARPRVTPADGPEDVGDPAGQSLKHYERLADRVADLVKHVADHLVPGA